MIYALTSIAFVLMGVVIIIYDHRLAKLEKDMQTLQALGVATTNALGSLAEYLKLEQIEKEAGEPPVDYPKH